MKITHVEALQIIVPLPKEERGSYWAGRPRLMDGFHLFRVHTDEGIIGDCITHARGPDWFAFIRDVVRPMLIGKDPFAIEPLLEWHGDLQYLAFRGRRPWFIEMALWDIIGKAAGLSVYKLLGGHKERVKAYFTSIWPGIKEEQDPEMLAADAVRYAEAGVLAMKIQGHRQDPREDVMVVETIRKRVGGKDKLEIMIDATRAGNHPPGRYPVPLKLWSHQTALWLAQEFGRLEVTWIEEPLPSWDLDGLADLTFKSPIPISGGEGEEGLHRFHILLDKKCYDIIQPDAQNSGGILTIKKIAALAEAYSKPCILHGTSGPMLAGVLQITGALPNCPWQEVALVYPPLFPWEMWAPLTPVWKNPIRFEDGYALVPQAPGLGVELDEKALARFTVKRV